MQTALATQPVHPHPIFTEGKELGAEITERVRIIRCGLLLVTKQSLSARAVGAVCCRTATVAPKAGISLEFPVARRLVKTAKSGLTHVAAAEYAGGGIRQRSGT